MMHRRGMRVAFVVTVAGGVMAAGCGSEPLIYTNPPPDASACPASPPNQGDVCSARADLECTWAGMACPPFAPASTTARCVAGRWEVSQVVCNPPPPSPDGGDASTVDASEVSADIPDGG